MLWEEKGYSERFIRATVVELIDYNNFFCNFKKRMALF